MIKKVTQWPSGEGVKTMAVTVWEPYGRVPGEGRRPLFPRSRCEALPAGFPRRAGVDFGGFGVPFGGPGGSISASKPRFSRGPVFSPF